MDYEMEKSVRKGLVVAVISSAWAFCALAARADHNDPINVLTNRPTAGMFPGSTMLQQPIAAPPPVAPPPPPPALPTSVTPNTFLMQTRTPSPVILPTDTLSVRSPLRSGMQGAINGKTPPPSVGNGAAAALPPDWDKWDKRFDFSEQNWILFGEAYSTDKYGLIHHHKADQKGGVTGKLAAEKSDGKTYEAAAAFDDQLSPKTLKEGSFIPTSSTHVSKVNDSTLQLNKGAVLVMSPARGVKVCTTIGGTSCVEFKGKAIAMVSVYDDKLAVLNLTDACCGSVAVVFPKDAKRQQLAVESGQILELYHDAQSPSTNLVATRVLASERLTEHHCCMVCQMNYIRALKKFQLEASLPKKELSRVLKTAAAMASLGR